MELQRIGQDWANSLSFFFFYIFANSLSFFFFFPLTVLKTSESPKGGGTLQAPIPPAVFRKAYWGSDSWLWKFTHIQILRGDMNTKCSEVLYMASWVKMHEREVHWALLSMLSSSLNSCGAETTPLRPCFTICCCCCCRSETLCQQAYTEESSFYA